MDNFQIETAQNVTINQNVAHLSTRIGSYLIDAAIIIGYYIVILLLFFALDVTIFKSKVVWVLLGLPIFFYSLIFETFLNGQTPGKRANKIRVVKIDGSKPTFGSYLIRWMLRLIDISLASGSVAILTILLNGKGQRLGDLAAGTTVISEKNKVDLSATLFTTIAEDYLPTYPEVIILKDADIQTIKTMYFDAKKNGNHSLILKLHEKIVSLLDIQPKEKPIDFIETILADYNYYTQQD